MTASLLLGGNQPIDPHTHTLAHTLAHTQVGSSALCSTTPDNRRKRRRLKRSKKTKKLHIFWLAVHYLALCLQPALKIDVSFLLVFKERKKRGIEPVK